MKMIYRATFTIPVVFDVKVEGENMLVTQAEERLREKAVKYLDDNFGHALGMEYCMLRRDKLEGGPEGTMV